MTLLKTSLMSHGSDCFYNNNAKITNSKSFIEWDLVSVEWFMKKRSVKHRHKINRLLISVPKHQQRPGQLTSKMGELAAPTLSMLKQGILKGEVSLYH